MLSNRRRLNLLVVLLIMFSVSATGCGSSDALSSVTANRLRAVAALYMEVAVSNRGTGPANEAAFKKFVKDVQPITLSANNIELPASRDDVFISERDQQPFAIQYGVSINGMSKTKAPLIAYEQGGVNGKKLVIFANQDLQEISNDAVQALLDVPK